MDEDTFIRGFLIPWFLGTMVGGIAGLILAFHFVVPASEWLGRDGNWLLALSAGCFLTALVLHLTRDRGEQR